MSHHPVQQQEASEENSPEPRLKLPEPEVGLHCPPSPVLLRGRRCGGRTSHRTKRAVRREPPAVSDRDTADARTVWGPAVGKEAAASRAPPSPAQPALLGPL